MGKISINSKKEAAASIMPDAELARAAYRGDKRAFVEIVARHQAMVCGIALGILKDFSASEDAAQEAFITAWRKIHDLQDPNRLRGWLAQIARNAALGHLRRQHPEEPLDQCEALADDAPSPDAAAATEEEAALVREALDRLPEIYRLPIILYYREGQSVHAVAEALAISEDAVKQRLARGREMLRTRVAGVIESVLTKTKPTAVFTMTIAAAIGALTAPPVIAASAFSAATVAGAAAGGVGTAPSAAITGVTATTAPTGSAILTFMSTSKGLLATAALLTILCIPVGYQLMPPTKARETLHHSAAKLQRATPTLSQPTFEQSALFAEWRRLHEIHGTNSAAMPALYKAISNLQDPFRRRAFRAALIAEWVQVDPNAGLAFFISNKDTAQRKQFFEEWLSVNPRAAVNALLAHPGYERLAQQCLVEIARKVPDRVLQIINDIPKPDSYWDTSIRDAVVLVAEGNLAATRGAVESMTGANRTQALAGIARAWGKNDLKAAVEWAKSLPRGDDEDFDPNEIVRSAIYGKATIDPVAALDQVGSVPAGGRPGYFADTTGARVLREAADADFDATVRWIVNNPGRLSREDTLGIAEQVTDRLNADPAGFLNQLVSEGSLNALMPAIDSALLNDGAGQRTAIWEWLLTQPENPTTKELRREVLNSAAYQEPELALKLAKDLENGPPEQRQELARALYNGGNMLHRFDALIKQAPEFMRAPLLQAAFEHISPDTLGDPSLWIQRLSQLPETERSAGLQSIARAWAGKSPEEAIGWLATQPPSDTRTEALGSAVQSWAHRDPSTAAEYISALPQGAERDRGTQSLVQALSERHPQEAWQWALTISHEPQRKSALADVIARTIERDPATARHWLETAPIDPEMKMNLEARLNSPSADLPKVQ